MRPVDAKSLKKKNQTGGVTKRVKGDMDKSKKGGFRWTKEKRFSKSVVKKSRLAGEGGRRNKDLGTEPKHGPRKT